MFGGYSIYLDGVVFAVIISDEEVCFKANHETKKHYEALGSTQWVYTGHKHKKPTAMPYWRVPEVILEDREQVEDWVRQAAAVSSKKI